MSHEITFKNGSKIHFHAPVTVRACQECSHFVASVITPGKGLCGLYSEIVARDDGCRRGFEARAPRAPQAPLRGQRNWLSTPVDLLSDDAPQP